MILPSSLLLIVLSVNMILLESETADHRIFVSRYLTTQFASRARSGRYDVSTIYTPPTRFLSRRADGSMCILEPTIYIHGLTISVTHET